MKEKICAFFKTKLWYKILVLLSSIYIFYYRYEIFDFKQFNAMNLIFILWLILLLTPLFSEIELFGVKLKKQFEKATDEVKEKINDLRIQVAEIKVSNLNKITNNINNSPLPSEKSLENTINDLRRLKPEEDQMYYIYVVNDKNNLLGTISLRDLIVAEPSASLESIMNEDYIFMHDNDDIDDLIKNISNDFKFAETKGVSPSLKLTSYYWLFIKLALIKDYCLPSKLSQFSKKGANDPFSKKNMSLAESTKINLFSIFGCRRRS
jgi:hypothetical protein